ncbi:MAG: HAMP domain-containing histidine kinase [Acidobacteria bacterium]|nr:HAMP domain-containing histidine kinase [Acidobacteriota bacterium]
MEEGKKHSFFYDWGSVTTYASDLRSQEMVARARWFINMRWYAILACAAGALVALLDKAPANLDPVAFLVVVAFLSAANLAYTLIGRNLFGDKGRERELQVLLAAEMMADFTALSYLNYVLGSIETPVAALFLAHIILSTLFFSRWRSLLITLAAWFYAVMPLVLEWAGILPARTIFDGGFKALVNGSAEVTFGFVFATAGVFLFCWDLVGEITTSLKMREHQLEDAHRMLIRLDKEKTQATLMATHELKAPFAVIKSFVYTLRDGYCGPLPEKAQEVVQRIGERCDQLTTRITDIIHLSNLRTLVVQEMHMTPVNIVDIVADQAREGALIAKTRGVSVTNHAENAPPAYILGSVSHLQSLFSNLLRNAVFYTHKETGRVDIFVKPEGKKVAVTVKDNGIGIPKENLEKIFNDHFRSKNALSHYAYGSGLGLSLVKEVVVLHGASIEVESTVGSGSSFTVRFDIIDATQEKANHGSHTGSR